ncbi:unnamed protein product [Orchesella dallaii]|uniref:Skp1-related protein n=1 Tax=Orchesella dallaii TaxID=48710 RepID=A0ABP1QMZ9_9HEXA
MANKISGKRPEEIRILLDIKTEIVHDHEQVANEPNVALETSDGVKCVVDYDVARSIPIIKEMIEEDNGVQDDKIYKLHNVNYDDLLNVLQWVKHHMARPSPPENARNPGSGDNNAENSWEEEFLNEMNDATQLALILACKELGAENLVNAACNKVGNMLKRKTVEEIREGLGIKDDFSDDEREEIRRQNQWAMPEVPPAE